MKGAARIRRAFSRSARALERRPALGQGTAITRVSVIEGLHCRIEDGRWSLEADLSEKGGGRGVAPDPGVFGRSALGSCLAMAYLQWAAALEVEIDALTVEIEADYDARGQYGVGGLAPSYRAIRYAVTIDSGEPRERIVELVETAEDHCPYLQIFRHPQEVTRRLEVRETAG